MSKDDATDLVFGVLPVMVDAVQAYATASGSLRTCRHYSKEVRSVFFQFKVHRDIFLNECSLLLQLIEDERGIEDMLEDATDDRWASKEVNDRLNRVLKGSYEQYRGHIEASAKAVQEIIEELSEFEVLIDQKAEEESVKSAMRRLRASGQINFDKSKCETCLMKLRDRNGDLSQLRAKIGGFQQQESCVESACVQRKTLPPHIRSIQNASQKLHEALSSAWRCEDTAHGEHCAKLCLDADVQTNVRLDLAISCHESSPQRERRQDKEPPIWLYVQSINIDAKDCGAMPVKRPIEPAAQPDAKRSDVPPNTIEQEPFREHSHARACRRKRIRKQVRFDDFNNDDEPPSCGVALTKDVSDAITKTVAQQATPWIDLCKTKNFCHYLKQNLKICGTPIEKHCVGFLESPRMYRHMFYLQDKPIRPKESTEGSLKTSLYSIIDIMDQDVVEFMTIPDQLKLAHKTALAILQFGSTPWLAERWRLRDLGYFGEQRVLDENALKTLHLSSIISSPGAHRLSSGQGVKGSENVITEEEQDYFGVNNTMLFSLGIALLEIAHWKPLESQMTSRYTSEIVAARRLARVPTQFGPKYEDLANKCLRCDFGFGNDLGKKELQAAVYTDIICPLERMIKSFTLD